MANRKGKRPGGRRPPGSLTQFGLLDMSEDLDNVGESDGDSDLEAELAAIAGGAKKAKPKSKPKPNLISAAELDNLVAHSMRDIPSDEDVSDGEDDPDLLNELSELATEDNDDSEVASEPPKISRPAPPIPTSVPKPSDLVSLLQERIEMYSLAEKNAQENGESSRARRIGRGLKTLKDQLKSAKAGKHVNEEDIPPAVSTGKQTAPVSNDTNEEAKPPPILPTIQDYESPSKPEVSPTEPELSDENITTLNMLTERKNQYKIAAFSEKKSGNNEAALAYLKVVKQFDKVIEAVKAGQPIDLSNMPGPPGQSQNIVSPAKEDEHTQGATDEGPSELPEGVPVALITANSVEEALQQRFELYKQQEAAATEAGNSSKARRMGRIVKQYQQAIKMHSAGKPIPFDELPTPPGYAPIPGAPPPPAEEVPAPAPPKPQPSPSPSSPATSSGEGKPSKLANTGRSNSVRKMGNQIGTGHVERQMNILLQRQKEFKEAALEAKKKGELKEAKEYLRCAKGIDPLLDAASGGLPVDLSTVPLPPQAKQELEDSYDIVTIDDCDPDEDGLGNVLNRLEEQLNSQLKLCMTTRDHHKALGDVAGTNRFEHLALAVKQDLDIIKLLKRMGGDPPKFHYETKQFSIVQSCTDLGDGDLELIIVRGLNYNVPNPKEVDTFVRFEFPYPQETPVRDKTSLVKNTNSPEYNASFTLPIHRASRPCLRVFKRHAVKLEVYSRGGLFSRDSLIGTINVKLQPLETQTVLHESFDLMDGRKTVGGKLEVKVRVRHPLLTKQVEQVTQKWLVINHD